MEIEHKNQNNNNIEDLKDLFEIDYVYENDPIKRTIKHNKFRGQTIFARKS